MGNEKILLVNSLWTNTSSSEFKSQDIIVDSDYTCYLILAKSYGSWGTGIECAPLLIPNLIGANASLIGCQVNDSNSPNRNVSIPSAGTIHFDIGKNGTSQDNNAAWPVEIYGIR